MISENIGRVYEGNADMDKKRSHITPHSTVERCKLQLILERREIPANPDICWHLFLLLAGLPWREWMQKETKQGLAEAL